MSSTEKSLENIKQEVASLTNSNALSSQSLTDLKQLDQLVEKILNDYHNSSKNPEPVADVTLAEVLYDFQPQQSGDLALKRGDKIIIIEKLSQDWFKGADSNKNEGVFPANYVKIIESKRESDRPMAPPPPPSYSSTNTVSKTNVGTSQSYYQQAPQQQQNYQQQVPPFPPASTNYYQQQQPVQQQPQQQQQQQQQPDQQQKPSKFGKIGSQLGNAFVFGAGATLGGDLVNSIF